VSRPDFPYPKGLRGVKNVRSGERGRQVKGFACCIETPFFLLALAASFHIPSSTGFFGLCSLRAATIQAFTAYVAKTEAQNADSLRDGPFLWIDSLPSHERSTDLAKVRAGEVVLRRLSVSKDGGNLEVPGGMIHDWQGIVFVPGAKLDQVLAILEDYDHESIYYSPDVSKSKIESHQDNQFRVFLQFRRHKVVTVVLDTEHLVTYYRDSPLRAHSRSSSIRISQLDDPGGPDEKERTPGDDDGYLWRMETWWRMEERDGGVYVQNQAVTLTRDIPTGLHWIIEPFITKIPEETLQFTLQATRRAVLNPIVQDAKRPASSDHDVSTRK